VLARTISLDQRKVETQVLHYDGFQWQAYSYKWNEQQTDADLVDAGGEQISVPAPDGAGAKRYWNIASRAQCLTCHNVWCNFTLAFQPGQLDREADFGGVKDNQVRTFRHIGFLITTPPPQRKPDPRDSSSEKLTLTDPYDTSAPLAERARSYLEVNCSACHRFGGGGSALFDVRKELSADRLNLIDAKPNLGGFGLEDARLVCPGDPNRSVLIYRTSKLGRGRMPHIGSDVVDVKGIAMLREWIGGIGAGQSDSNGSTVVDANVVDRLVGSTSGALRIVGAIDSGKLSAEAVKTAIAKGIASPEEQVRDLFRRFDPASNVPRLGGTINSAALLARHGDAGRGRNIFFDASGTTGLCARCHKANGRGSDFGPDLSHIATRYGRADLLDNILNPSKSIAQGFTTYLLRTKSGNLASGILVSNGKEEVVLKDAQLNVIRVPASDVDKLSPQAISSMPEGLLSDLTIEQAVDLMAYVESLK